MSVRVIRGVLTGCGLAVAMVAVGLSGGTDLGVAGSFIGLVAVFNVFPRWRDHPVPFRLPFLATPFAWVYVGGWAIVALDYVIGLVRFVVITTLGRRGWFTVPPPWRYLVDPAIAPVDRWMDHGAVQASGMLALGARVLVYGAVRQAWPQLHPTTGVIAGEVAGFALLIAIHLLLPMPATDVAAEGQPWRLALDDSRLDIVYPTVLLLPLMVVLITHGWVHHGVVGAIGWTLATLGPDAFITHLDRRRQVLTERNHLLFKRHHELERRQRFFGALVPRVNHALQRRLSGLLAASEGSGSAPADGVSLEGREDVRRILRLARQAEFMVRDLADLFRIVWAAEETTVVDLDREVAEILETFAPQMRAKGVRVTVDALPAVRGQRLKLRHALQNLVSNAVKYVEADRGRIEITGRGDGSTVRLCVRDNGIGLASEFHPAVFELFSRAPGEAQVVDGREVRGTGVGLAVVKRVAELHGGRVGLRSSPAGGSEFWIELPAP